MKPIYLDYNATTPIDPAVHDAMAPYLREHFGNPSCKHAYGTLAHEAVEKARQQVAGLLHADREEIVFTGGGSEASNHAIKGAVFGRLVRNEPHVITSAIEHPATLKPCEFLKRLGCSVTVLPVDGTGRVDPDAVRRAIRKETALITIMHSNNEVGTLQPIREIAAIARERGILTHTDAAQSMGKLSVNVRELGIDLITVAGHKLYAPKGIGVLFIRKGVQIDNLIHGAGHESGRRAGTENVPYLVGLGEAAEIARQSLSEVTEQLTLLRDRLEERLRTYFG
ncbi:MAG TPA: cysteine desulfurase family protein, partial [Gemmataceae bacterium]|nr:cysteine desulfurase family protein [Gemmataceae bacterium]